MPFLISVYRRTDMPWIRNPPRDVLGNPELFLEEARRRLLYDAPLGSGSVVFEYWSAPAASLGLALLPQLYESGLEVSGEQLAELEHELSVLQRKWIQESIEPRQLAQLQERLGYLREAVQVARTNDGVVDLR